MSKIIDDYWDLPHRQREALRDRVRRVNCGPGCECDTPKTGISIAKMDTFGVYFPEAAGVVLDKVTHEWVVYELDGSEFGTREAARYPVDEVEAIRYLPNEIRLYSHMVLDEEPLQVRGTSRPKVDLPSTLTNIARDGSGR